MGRRFWIILGIVLIVGLAVFIFLIWQKQAENKKAPSEGLATGIGIQKSSEFAGNEPRKEPEKALAGDNLIIEESKGLEFKPFFGEEGEKIKETFLEQFSALSNPSISAPESVSDKKEQSVASAPIAASASEAMSIEIILSLTDDEFHFLYPDAFITSLAEAQNLFIKEYDPTYEPLPKIENDSQVRFIEEKITASLLSLGMITEEEAHQFITTIRFTLPQLQLIELKNRKISILNKFVPTIEGLYTFFNKGNQSQIPKKGLFFGSLLDKLYNLLTPKAQAKVCGYCYRSLECYQIGIPVSITGYNVFKAFCYCTGCYHGQGCLDFCESMSAIWDPLTGICGCG